MVGASASEMRPSYFAMLYLLNSGYEIDPVNPHHAGQIQGRLSILDLLSLPERPDMVQIFRRLEEGAALGRGGDRDRPGDLDAAWRAPRGGGGAGARGGARRDHGIAARRSSTGGSARSAGSA
ncbi:MAG: CoA-binding protein [Geminicoccaceae bacterium]